MLAAPQCSASCMTSAGHDLGRQHTAVCCKTASGLALASCHKQAIGICELSAGCSMPQAAGCLQQRVPDISGVCDCALLITLTKEVHAVTQDVHGVVAARRGYGRAWVRHQQLDAAAVGTQACGKARTARYQSRAVLQSGLHMPCDKAMKLCSLGIGTWGGGSATAPQPPKQTAPAIPHQPCSKHTFACQTE